MFSKAKYLPSAGITDNHAVKGKNNKKTPKFFARRIVGYIVSVPLCKAIQNFSTVLAFKTLCRSAAIENRTGAVNNCTFPGNGRYCTDKTAV